MLLKGVGILFLSSFISAFDPFEATFRLERCFPVKSFPDCNTTLTQSFTSDIEPKGLNDPDTYVYLFTPDSPDEAEELHLCGGRLAEGSTYDVEANTEVFIHGWLDGVCKTAWMRESKDLLMTRDERYNVIIIDWSWGNTPDYALAGSNCRIAGEQTGFVINNIMEQTGVGPEKFHVIGHSYGAIAAGYTGRKVNGLRRITALDPALSGYRDAPPDQRLTYRDAKIVDVIHTDISSCYPVSIGDPRPLGHADFYVNGGLSQKPSCTVYGLQSIIKLDILYALVNLLYCNHLHALQYYKTSIKGEACEYVGVESDSYESFQKKSGDIGDSATAVMGMNYEKYRDPNDEERRTYYLTTAIDCPYVEDSYLGGRQFQFNTSCKSNSLL